MTHPTKEQGREDWEATGDLFNAITRAQTSVTPQEMGETREEINECVRSLLASARSSERERTLREVQDKIKDWMEPTMKTSSSRDLLRAIHDGIAALRSSPDPLTNEETHE